MPKYEGKQRLLAFTIKSTWTSYEFAKRRDRDEFIKFMEVCNIPEQGNHNKYAHPPTLEIVKKYFDNFLAKTDYEDSMDRFRELHKKLVVRLSPFCKPGVECVRGLILFFAYTSQLLTTYDQFFEAAKYLNDNSQWKIDFSEIPTVSEDKILGNLENEELLLYTIICFAYQTYKVSLKYDTSALQNFDHFARNVCGIDKPYNNGPISTHVPSYRSIRKSFEDFYPIYTGRPGKEQFIRAYKMIERENKKGCKAAVHGLLLFFGYMNGLLKTYEEIFEVALELTKYTRPNKVIIANFDPDALVNNFLQQQQQVLANTEVRVKAEDNVDDNHDKEINANSTKTETVATQDEWLLNMLTNLKKEPMVDTTSSTVILPRYLSTNANPEEFDESGNAVNLDFEENAEDQQYASLSVEDFVNNLTSLFNLSSDESTLVATSDDAE